MKPRSSIALVGLLFAGVGPCSAWAQTLPQNPPPAVVTDHADSHNAAAPVPGKNSFTEAQARDRLEHHGYSAVSGLQLDNDQIWRATATKDGHPVKVALDYQGNIVGQ
jgi:hypothetical protein